MNLKLLTVITLFFSIFLGPPSYAATENTSDTQLGMLNFIQLQQKIIIDDLDQLYKDTKRYKQLEKYLFKHKKLQSQIANSKEKEQFSLFKQHFCIIAPEECE